MSGDLDVIFLNKVHSDVCNIDKVKFACGKIAFGVYVDEIQIALNVSEDHSLCDSWMVATELAVRRGQYTVDSSARE